MLNNIILFYFLQYITYICINKDCVIIKGRVVNIIEYFLIDFVADEP